MSLKVLLIEDDEFIRQSTEQWLLMAGFEVESFSSAEPALLLLHEAFEGVVVTDVKMPGMDGLTLMKEARAKVPELPVILVTGHGDIDMAIQATRDGAYDFIEKPFEPERLVSTIRRACEARQLKLENLRLQQNLASQSGIDQRLIGISPAIDRLRREVLKCAALDTNVIIYGETGTGKELVSQCLHEFSQRKNHHFVPINCGAIPEQFIESELFGHEAGAFTGAQRRRVGKFEYAHKGTLLLDEIESMGQPLQVKLLRALQENRIERLGSCQPIDVDVRVVAASKADLRSEEGFREDLFYRLNVSQIHIPPLRQRTEDIPLLFEHYVRRAAGENNQHVRPLQGHERQLLEGYSWPGNVRELKNIAVRYAVDQEVDLRRLLYPDACMSEPVAAVGSMSLSSQVAHFEAEVISQSLSRHKGNIKAVMEELDLPRRTLNQKMQKYALNRERFTVS